MAPRSSQRLKGIASNSNNNAAAAPILVPPAPPPGPLPSTLVRTNKKKRKETTSTPPDQSDRISQLPSEITANILSQLSPPASPDLISLFHLATTSQSIWLHTKIHLYRDLKINTRTDAHAIHRTLHGNDVNRCVKSIEADVGKMAKTSSQWLGRFFSLMCLYMH